MDADEKLPIELAHVVLRRGGSLSRTMPQILWGRSVFMMSKRDIQHHSLVRWLQNIYRFSLCRRAAYCFQGSASCRGYNDPGSGGPCRPELAISHIDVRSGNQVFEAETYHVPPTARMTTLIQENVMGAARAPTGEVHIRGAARRVHVLCRWSAGSLGSFLEVSMRLWTCSHRTRNLHYGRIFGRIWRADVRCHRPEQSCPDRCIPSGCLDVRRKLSCIQWDQTLITGEGSAIRSFKLHPR